MALTYHRDSDEPIRGLTGSVTINPDAEIELPVKTVPVGGIEGVSRGLKSGVAQIGQMAGGVGMLAGNVLSIPWLEEKGLEAYKKFGREAEINRPRVGRIEDIDNFGDAMDYVASTVIAQNLPNMVASLAGGAAGAGIAARFAGGPMFRTISQNTARGLAAKILEKEGIDAAKDYVTGKRKLGAAIGSYLSETAMEAGIISGEMKEAGAENLAGGIPFAAAAGAVGTYADVKLLEKIAPGLFGKDLKRGIGKSASRVAGMSALEGTTEGTQTVIEKVPVTMADPTKGLGSPTAASDILNGFAAGLIMGTASAGAAELPRLLNPDKNPLVNQTEQDILAKANSKIKSNAQQEADKLLQEAAQGGTTATDTTESEGESISANDFAAAWPDSFGTLTSLYEKEVGRPSTDQEKELLFQAAESGMRLAEVETELDRAVMDEKDSPELQEERKQLRERINTIQAELQGIPKEGPTRQKDATKEAGYIQKVGADREGAKQYKALKKIQAKPEAGKGKETKAIEQAIDKAYTKVQRLVGAIKVKLMSSEAMENDPNEYAKVKGFGAGMKGQNLAVGFDDEGNLYLAVPSPERVRESIGDDKGTLQTWTDTLEKNMEHEAIHLAVFENWKRQWAKGGKKQTFTDFVTAKSRLLDQAFQNSLSDSTMQAFVNSYGLTLKGSMSPETRANELIRAVIERMRTGQTSEDLTTLSVLKNQGNKFATEFLDALLAMVRQVRDAILGVINPDIMRGEIKSVVDNANEILDRWGHEEGIPAPPASPAPATAPTTPTSQQNAPQGNVAQAQATQDNEPKQKQVPPTTTQGQSPQAAPTTQGVEQGTETADQITRAGSVTPEPIYAQTFEIKDKGGEGAAFTQEIRGSSPEDIQAKVNKNYKAAGFIANPTSEAVLLQPRLSGFAYQPDMFDAEKADFRTWAGSTTPAEKYRKAEETVSQGIASLLDYASSDLKAVPKTVSSKMATYFGDFFRGAFHDKKLQRTTVMAAANFIKENGFISAARRLASGTTGLQPEEDIVLAGAIIQTSNAYMDDMRDFAGDWKDVSVTAKTQAMGEVAELANKARDILSAMAKSGGRQVNILGWMKKTLFDGGAAANDVSNMIYAAMSRMEPGINRESLGGLVAELREIFDAIADRVFSENEMFNFIQHTANKLLQDPMALKRRLRDSLKVAAADKVGQAVGARAGEFELQTDDGIRKMFDTIAGHLLGLEPEGKSNKEASAKRLLRSALQTMAEQYMPEIKEVQEAADGSPRALKVLATLIANDNLRQQFIDVLENQAAAQFAKGKADPAFKSNYAAAFKSMREGDYLAGLRRDAAASMARAIKGSVASMLPTWSDSKEEAMALLNQVNAGLSPETRDFLYNEINRELDRLAEAHLEKTWGFARNEDGKFDLTKKGSLKGGTELKAFLKEMGTSLTNLTKLTYASREAKIDALAEGMVTQLGLPLEMALGAQSIFQKNLKDAVEWQQAKNLERRVEQIKSTLSDKNKAKNLTPKGFIDKVVELAAQGYLDDKVAYEAITKSYHRKNMPEFSATMGAKIRELANGMEDMPEGYEKDQIRQVIANEIANMIPLNFGDAATSYWYFSLLSGFSTWGVVNPISNLANLFGNMASLASTNPGKTAKILATFYRSVMSKDSAAWSRYKYTMETGFTPVAIGPKLFLSQGEKLGEGSAGKTVELASLPVERINREMASSKSGSLLDRIGRKILYGISRGIKLGKIELSARSLTRFMSATDQFFRVAGTDIGLAAYSQTDFDALYKAAQPMAAAEGKRGNDILIRAREIAFQQLAEKGEAEGYAIQNAEKVGFESSFTQVPKGAVGQLARMLGNLANTYPAFRIIFPFTNIVANVWNESLNYTPLGAWRYTDAKQWGIYNEKGELVRDPTLVAKAIMGLMAFAIMAMLDGDDEDYFEITGQGPRDRMDRVAFFERGMKPYSFRAGDMVFSYQYLGPLSHMLGIAGTMIDLIRDRRQADDPAMEKLFALTSSLFTNQMSQSFLSSASSLFEAIYSTDPGGKLQRWGAFQVGSLVPNIAKQINNDFIDNDYYRSSDFTGQVLNAWSVTKRIGNEPAMSYYGEQRENKRWPVIGRVVSEAGGDRTIADLSALNLRLPGFTEQINGVDMTDKQKTQFRRIAGPQLKEAHDRLLPRLRQLVAAGKTQDAQDLLDETSANINRQARRQIPLDAMRSR